jgi:hypothetical protein
MILGKLWQNNANLIVPLLCLPPLACDELSLDHSIHPRQHVGRNREADLFSRLQINHQLDFRRLLDWQIGRVCTFKTLST